MSIFLKKIKQAIRQKKQKGFTLLETLVAIFLLTLALTGPIYIATLAIRSSVESRDSISAYYLAEEVVEVIRNNRDTRSFDRNGGIDGEDWLISQPTSSTFGSITGGVDCFNETGGTNDLCTMTRDATLGEYIFKQCTAGICEPLSFDPNATNGIIYGDDNGPSETSKFTREFYIQSAVQDPQATTDNPIQEIKLVVTIKWQDKGRDKQFQLVEHLYNLKYLRYAN